MAHKKAGGSTRNGRDSNPKYLGIKKYGGEVVQAGAIIVRQRGNTFYAGENVGCGRDYTIYAKCDGNVTYRTKGISKRKYVYITPLTHN